MVASISLNLVSEERQRKEEIGEERVYQRERRDRNRESERPMERKSEVKK